MSKPKKHSKSEDYKKLMKLIHDDGYSLTEIHLNLDNIEGKPGFFTENSRFVLKKGKDKIELTSTEEDLGSLVWHLKTFPNLDYENEFRKVVNLEKYFDDIKFLIDKDGQKLQNASAEVSKGDFKFEYKVEELIDTFLNETTNKARSNPRYKKLREDYYYILLYHLDVLHRSKELLDRYNKEDSNFKHFNSFFFKRIMECVQADKPVQMYRNIIELLNFDPADKLSIYTAIKQDNNELFSMMQSYYGSSTSAAKVAPRLLDMYRRFAEYCSDFVEFFTRIENKIEKKEFDSSLGFNDNYGYLCTKKDYVPILKSLDPQIRHSESHLNTKTGESIGKIVITEKDGRRRKIIKEYSYQEFEVMLKEIDNSLTLAFAISVMSAYTIILHQVLISFEYKVLLLGIGNRQ